jgi:hypothetical protein
MYLQLYLGFIEAFIAGKCIISDSLEIIWEDVSFGESDECLWVGEVKSCLYVLDWLDRKEIITFLAEVWAFVIDSDDIGLLALVLEFIQR